MTAPQRASLNKRFSFTEKQKSELTVILRRRKDSGNIKSFLNSVENLVQILLSDFQIVGEVPPEPSTQSINLLKTISRHAKALYSAINNLDLTGSDVYLAIELSNLGRSYKTIEYLEDKLPLLHICAKKAAENVTVQPPGRPLDSAEHMFIGAVGGDYTSNFDKAPTHSRGSEFPTFICKVLEFALPGNPHSVRDNSKVVTAALKAAGIIS